MFNKVIRKIRRIFSSNPFDEDTAKEIGKNIPPREDAESTVPLTEGIHTDLPVTSVLSSVRVARGNGDLMIGFSLSKKWRNQGNPRNASYALAWYVQNGKTFIIGPVSGAISVKQYKTYKSIEKKENITFYLTDLHQTERTNAVNIIWGQEVR